MERRKLIKGLGAGAFGMIASGISSDAVAGRADDEVDLSFVHPELMSVAAVLARVDMQFNAKTLPLIRSGRGLGEIAELGSTPKRRTAVPITERRVPVAGHPDVLVYVINSGQNRGRPAILHAHGGGFISGSAKSDLDNLADLASQLDCVIVSVEYRLAPETRYLGSVEDNYGGLKWLHGNSDELGVDRKRIAVMGESAGGCHAALLAIMARDRGEVPLCFQALIYPMLDDRTVRRRRLGKNVGRFGWSAASNAFGWGSFLGTRPGLHDVPAAAVPARVNDLSALPPAFIQVGGIDLFLDEDLAYAQRLVAAHVATELHVVPGAFHGFDLFVPEASVVKGFRAAKKDALKRAFEIVG